MLSKKGDLVEQRNTEELQKIECDKQDNTIYQVTKLTKLRHNLN